MVQKLFNLTLLFMTMTTFSQSSIHDFKFNSINGEEYSFASFKGNKILIVNTASECGFTPQYKDLQELHNQYKDQLVIIGVPCNQFGKQEPGNADEIKSFCSKNYGVTFLITEKIEVKGGNQRPLYHWLTTKEMNGVKSSSVKWNFQKYLIGRNGEFIDFYYSITSPMSEKIVKNLSK